MPDASQPMSELSRKVLADYRKDLRAGALVTAEPGRIRIRQSVK